MADKNERPVQHTPKHLADGAVFDPRHPAASSFAPMQPALGVVADDVDENGQNLAGGPKASEAQKANMDQREKLVENYERDLRAKAGVDAPADTPVVDGAAKAAPAKAPAAKVDAKPEDK
jgi:hypothetical protein